MYDIEQPYGPLIETTLRVASWNVWGRNGPWERREQAIVRTLEPCAPDIVTLLEAWNPPDDAPPGAVPEEGQPERIGRRLGLPYHAFLGGPGRNGHHTGIAVLSRWPIAERGDQALGDRRGRDGGQVLFTEIAGPRGPIQLFAGLLAWRLDHGLLRQGQIRDLATYVGKTQDLLAPVLLCGGFNACPDSDEIRMLTGRAPVAAPGVVFYDSWEMAGDGGRGHTWSNANPWAAPALLPDRRIDYVLSAWPRAGAAGAPAGCRIIGAEAVDGVMPSDHYGLVADVRY